MTGVIVIKGGRAFVSGLDFDWAVSRPWHLGDTGYAKCYSGTTGGTPLRMHRLIMERMLGRALLPSELVDHANGNPLDNRRENLRLASKSQNGMNRRRIYGSSRYQGVSYDKARNKWSSYLNVNGQRVRLPRSDDEDEAAWMRDQFALALHGDFAHLNFEYVPIEALQ